MRPGYGYYDSTASARALGFGAAAYISMGVERGMQATARFFNDLVRQLRPVLEAKGFRLTRHVYLWQSFGHRIATFEGASRIVDLAWEGRDREILLLQRRIDQSNVAAGDHLADAHIPQGALAEVYARAAETIMRAAELIGPDLTGD